MQKVYKIAMVTGAATGFGLATVKQLMASGYKVACCDTSFVHSAPDESFLEEIDGQGSAMFYGMNPLSTGDVVSIALASRNRSHPSSNPSGPPTAKRLACLSIVKSTWSPKRCVPVFKMTGR